MAVYIFGGSNSIYQDGWVRSLSQQIGQPVVNRSVGATTTLTGIFRFLLSGDGDGPGHGDHVVWEYALNDVNHVSTGYSRDLLLKNVEHFMLWCRQRGCRFIPLIMTPRAQEKAEQRDLYYQLLADLMAHYGIASFDISLAWRERNGGERFPEALYADAAHYAREPELMTFIGSGVAALFAQARVPASVTPRYTMGRRLTLVKRVQQGFFENSLLRVPTAQIPLSLDLPGQGRVAAICALFHGEFESGMRVELWRGAQKMKQLRFSTTNKTRRRITLKAVSLENASGAEGEDVWAFDAGDRLVVAPARFPGKFYAENEVRSPLTAPRQKPAGRIVGVFVESLPEATESRKVGWLQRGVARLRGLLAPG